MTSDVQAAIDGAANTIGWLVQKTSGNGNVRYYSREGAAAVGDPSLARRLVLEFAAPPAPPFELCFLRARYYGAEIGRFIGRDKLRFAQRYAYVVATPRYSPTPAASACSELRALLPHGGSVTASNRSRVRYPRQLSAPHSPTSFSTERSSSSMLLRSDSMLEPLLPPPRLRSPGASWADLRAVSEAISPDGQPLHRCRWWRMLRVGDRRLSPASLDRTGIAGSRSFAPVLERSSAIRSWASSST